MTGVTPAAPDAVTRGTVTPRRTVTRAAALLWATAAGLTAAVLAISQARRPSLAMRQMHHMLHALSEGDLKPLGAASASNLQLVLCAGPTCRTLCRPRQALYSP